MVGRSTLAIVAAYAACVLIWGTTWFAIKLSLHGFPPVTGAGVRFVAAGAILYATAIVLRIDLARKPPPFHLIAVLALTMFGVNYALTYFAETQLPSGLVAVLFGTLPFFVFGFAGVMVGERVSWTTLVGAACALCGVATISLVGDVRGRLLYVFAALGASASSGFANVYLKRYSYVEPLATLPPAMLLGGAGMIAWGARFEHTDWVAATSASSLYAIAYLAVCGSAIAFYLNHWLLQRIDSGIVGLSALLIPVIAVAVGALLGRELLGPRDLAGAALVIGGLWLSLVRPATHVKPTVESQVSA
ncbi:MAG: EamA family transporter [Candidatus Eremiobacteraeota bacterium]|nr:EamA family transporter [Candidatus Eremiobacteraeota bacterium]